MATGTVKFFNSEKGWGFIASDELNPQKARILLTLALMKNTPKDQLQAMYRAY